MTRKGFGIKNLAEMLHISVSTVSRALRDAHDINPHTKQKVLQLAKELNFKPNKNAAALASGNTKNIAVMIPFVNNYYFGTVIAGIQDQAYLLGYNIVLLVTNDEVEKERQLIENLDTSSIDGLMVAISSETKDTKHFEELVKQGIPLVFFDRAPDTISASKVIQSDREGALTATRLLIAKGYRRIAHLAGPEHLHFSKERYQGYCQALQQAGHPVDPDHIIFSSFSLEQGYADTMLLFQGKHPPDAIFAVNDRKAIGAIKALKELGKLVGTDIGVIGFTNDPMCTIVEPNLTTMEEPAWEIGKQSCQLLIKHIKNKDFEIRSMQLPCHLIIRDSC